MKIVNAVITDYQIVEDTYARGVEKRVQELIKEGWQPYGSLVALPAVRGTYPATDDPYPTFCQAMVKVSSLHIATGESNP